MNRMVIIQSKLHVSNDTHPKGISKDIDKLNLFLKRMSNMAYIDLNKLFSRGNILKKNTLQIECI
jgi:hypothetical protein